MAGHRLSKTGVNAFCLAIRIFEWDEDGNSPTKQGDDDCVNW
jgi:hypothetical protein